jgi:hypothetical protein
MPTYYFNTTSMLRIEDIISAVAATLIAPLIISAIKQFFVTIRQSHKIEVAEKDFNKELEKNEPIVKYVDKILNLVIERDKLTMIKARGRSNYLFFIGTFLMILSVFAPVVTIGIYMTTEPISYETIEVLKNIKSQLGVVPSIKDIINQRDWRILLSGISFGFLFLAAARALLRQENRQITTYINLNRRISLFENTASALKIAERIALDGDELSIDDLPQELQINHLIIKVINILLPTSEEVREFLKGEKQVDQADGDMSSFIKEQIKAFMEGGKNS